MTTREEKMSKKIGTKPELNDQEHKIEIEYIINKKKQIKDKHDDIKTYGIKLRKKEKEIKNLRKENAELKEEYLRQLADKDNLRKRLEREKNEFYQYALSEFLSDLIVVLDNFERALETEDQNNSKGYQEGIKMIYKQYQDVLMKQGVTHIDTKDRKFDPNLHQAFVTEESEDVEEVQISEELQRGYTLHNRLLRPSLVKVIIPKKEK